MLAQMVVSYLVSIWQCEQTISTQVMKSHHIKMYYNVSACHFSSWLIMLWLAASHDCSYTTKNLTTGNRHGQENHTGAECPGPAAILRPPPSSSVDAPTQLSKNSNSLHPPPLTHSPSSQLLCVYWRSFVCQTGCTVRTCSRILVNLLQFSP